MPKRFSQMSRWLLAMALLASMGGHFALLQTIAWGNMLVEFSSQSSLSEAVGKTFDGKHPCALCKVVKQSKGDEEKKPALLKSEMKWEIALPAPVKVPIPRAMEVTFRVTAYERTFSEVDPTLPLRPPRAA